MPIHDQSYRHWEGTFRSHSFRWWVITKAGLRIILQRKLFLLLVMAPSAINFIGSGAAIYLMQAIFKVPVNEMFFLGFFGRQGFFIILICVFGGSGLIANDLKNNSLQLYFSKPLTRLDYLVGKSAIVMILMAFLTVVPGVILFLERTLLPNGMDFLKDNYWMLGSIVLYSFILTLPTGLLILALSSITRNSRYAAISFIAILVGTPILSEMLRAVSKSESAIFISYVRNMVILGQRLFGLSRRPDNWYWSIFIILGIVGVCIWTMHRKVKGVEIVK